MPRIFILQGHSMDDRVSDLAGDHVPGRDRFVRRDVVSEEIVRFISCPRGDFGGLTDFPTIAFRFVAEVDNCADAALRERASGEPNKI
jgi:hypothetical protein